MSNVGITGNVNNIPVGNPNIIKTDKTAVEKTGENNTPEEIKDEKNIPSLTAGKVEKPSISFVDGHDNDITILSATRIGESAVTWLSPAIIKNWPKDKPLDEVLTAVSKMENIGHSIGHHPSLFTSRESHEEVKNRYSLVFANSDYNRNGEPNDEGDLPDVSEEGKNLEKAYKEHDYNTTLYENFNDNKIKEQIKNKIRTAEPGDEIVIHYSGHGSPNGIEGTNGLFGLMLNPVQDTLFNSEIRSLVNEAKDKGIKMVIILDSCESGYTTDYIRASEMQGINRSLNSFKNDSLTTEEQKGLAAVKSKLELMKSCLQEIDELHASPVELEFEGKKYSVPFNKSQDYTGRKFDNKFSHESHNEIYELQGNKFKIQGEIYQIENDILTLQLNIMKYDVDKIDASHKLIIGAVSPAESAALKTKAQENTDAARKSIEEKKTRLAEANIELKEAAKKAEEYKTPKSQADQFFEAMNTKISERNRQISEKEKALDSLIAESYQGLESINGYKSEMSDVNMERWSFGFAPLFTATQGPMLELNTEYKLYERNRFSNISLKAGLAFGDNTYKTSETIKYNFSNNNWGLETGFSQRFGENESFKNMFRMGADYRVNNWLTLNGGFDISPHDEKRIDRLNPYVGANVNISSLLKKK
jgi:hypothetical protein